MRSKVNIPRQIEMVKVPFSQFRYSLRIALLFFHSKEEDRLTEEALTYTCVVHVFSNS